MLIAAIDVALLAGSALTAANFGLLDFWDKAMPDANEYVVDISSVNAIESDHVRYEFREALIDGEYFYLTVDMTPLDPSEYLLMDAVDTLAIYDKYLDTGKTYREYADEYGMKLLGFSVPQITLSDDQGEYESNMGSMRSYEYDGKLTLLTEYKYTTPIRGNTLNVAGETFDYLMAGETVEIQEDGELISRDIQEKSRRSFEFTIDAKPLKREVYTYEKPVELQYITIQSIELSKTSLSTEIRVYYTGNDTPPDEYMHVYFDIPEMGEPSDGYSDFTENGYSMWSMRWDAIDELPDEITIELSGDDAPEWSESFTIALSDMKLEETQG